MSPLDPPASAVAPEPSARFLLIDHQNGTMSWVHSTPFEVMKANALALARVAKAS
jgi:hypothetical protein